MKGQLKLDFLIKEIDITIEIFEKRRNRHRTQSMLLKLSSIIASALVTVLLGLKSVQNSIITDVTLILSVLISIFNGIEGFYNHRGLWMKDVKTLASLYELKRDLEFYLTGEDEEHITLKILTTFKNRLQVILEEDVKSWNKIKEEQSLLEHDEKNMKI